MPHRVFLPTSTPKAWLDNVHHVSPSSAPRPQEDLNPLASAALFSQGDLTAVKRAIAPAHSLVLSLLNRAEDTNSSRVCFSRLSRTYLQDVLVSVCVGQAVAGSEIWGGGLSVV